MDSEASSSVDEVKVELEKITKIIIGEPNYKISQDDLQIELVGSYAGSTYCSRWIHLRRGGYKTMVGVRSHSFTHNQSPTTNLPLAHPNLIPNRALRSSIQEWLQRHGV
ncbi:hypothetical protein SAY87_010495 [Trapa incisa]|uniref:U-box domain-containing protein n=1 Tax=Trapa incisa TaxID=236973 RepID=A0AAN7GPL0_9MYRT|nr:hypothetical protein SAY87_010495 [Trapa incisa]